MQAVLPSAALGLIEKPGGRVTVARAQLGRRGYRRALLLGDGQVDVDPRGGVGLGRGRLRIEARIEAELVAAGHLRPRVTGAIAATVVGEDVEGGAERRVAVGRVLEEGGERAVGGGGRDFSQRHGMRTVFGSAVLVAPFASQRSPL